MPHGRRLLAAIAVLFLAAAGCQEAEQAAEEAREQTEEAAEDVDEAVDVDFTGGFEISGTVTDADLGQIPDVDLPVIDEDDPDEAQRQPDDPGMLQVEAASFSGALGDTCGTEEGDTVEVFWTNDTYFTEAALADDFPEALVDSSVMATGRFATVDIDIDGSDPDDNPCVLVASKVVLD